MRNFHYEGSQIWGRVPPSVIEWFKDYFKIDGPLRSVHVFIDDSLNNQKENIKMNTATKLSFEERFKQMNEYDQYSVPQSMFRDVRDAKDLYDWLEEIISKSSEEEAKQYKLAQNEIIALQLDKIDLSKAFAGLQSSPIETPAAENKDVSKSPAKVKEKGKVIQMTPKVDEPAEEIASKEETPKAEETKVEEPKNTTTTEVVDPVPFKDISDTVKSLIKEGKQDEARAYAQATFGSGMYIPKKENQKPEPWAEKKLNSWFNDILANLKIPERKDNSDIKPQPEQTESKTNPLEVTRALLGYRNALRKGDVKRVGPGEPITDEEKSKLNNLSKYDHKLVTEGFSDGGDIDRDKIINFGLPTSDLITEEATLGMFAERILQLRSQGSEDKEIAKELVPMFFENRGYSPKQYNNWLDACEEAGIEKLDSIDHFSVLGVPELFFPEGLQKAECTQDDIMNIINSDKSLEEKQFEALELLSGKIMTWDGSETSLFTDLHVLNYIEKLDAFYTKEKETEQSEEETPNEPETKDSFPLDELLAACELAAKDDVSEEDFIKEFTDIIKNEDGTWKNLADLRNPKEKKVVEINSDVDFNSWVHSVYKIQEKLKEREQDKNLENSKENGAVEEETENTDEQAVKVLMGDLKKSMLAHKEFSDFAKTDLYQQMIKFGVVIDEFDDPDSDGRSTHFFSNAVDDLKKYLKALFIQTHEKEGYTKPDTFEDGEVRINAFAQLKDEGQKLIEKGYDEEKMISWVKRNILNRQLEDQPNKDSVFTDEEVVKDLTRVVFGYKAKEEKPSEVDSETGYKLIDQLIMDEKTDALTIVKSAKDISAKMGNPKGLNVVHRYVMMRMKQINPEKWIATRAKARSRETERQVYVAEKFSELHPKAWEELKDINSLADLHDACVAYRDQEDWKVALSLALEVLKLGNVKQSNGADTNWDDKTIATWFSDNLLNDPTNKIPKPKAEGVKESKEEKKEEQTVETPNEESKYPEVMTELAGAQSQKAFRRSLEAIMRNHEDTAELRKDMISAINFGNGKHTRKVKGTPEKDLHSMFNKAKERIEKYSGN